MKQRNDLTDLIRHVQLCLIYFYQRNLLYNPSENNYLNDKIMSHLHTPIKLNIESSDNYDSFEDLIKYYKIPIPLEKIDNEYNYNTLKLLLQKYNYDFDNIFVKPLTEIVNSIQITRQQGLLTNGKQSTGNLFILEENRTKEIKKIINKYYFNPRERNKNIKGFGILIIYLNDLIIRTNFHTLHINIVDQIFDNKYYIQLYNYN